MLILANILHKTPEVVGEFMFLDPGEVQCLLFDLASVVKCVDRDRYPNTTHIVSRFSSDPESIILILP